METTIDARGSLPRLFSWFRYAYLIPVYVYYVYAYVYMYICILMYRYIQSTLHRYRARELVERGWFPDPTIPRDVPCYFISFLFFFLRSFYTFSCYYSPSFLLIRASALPSFAGWTRTRGKRLNKNNALNFSIIPLVFGEQTAPRSMDSQKFQRDLWIRS